MIRIGVYDSFKSVPVRALWAPIDFARVLNDSERLS